jgi:hypothetical protein
MELGGFMSWSTSSSSSMSKSISISMWWSSSWSTSRFGSGDKIFGGMEPTKMIIMTVWRLRDYEIAVHPN